LEGIQNALFEADKYTCKTTGEDSYIVSRAIISSFCYLVETVRDQSSGNVMWLSLAVGFLLDITEDRERWEDKCEL
jgi:hypothetical protein